MAVHEAHAAGEAELAADSIGFVDALVIGLNATSPAYSLAAVIGPIVALVGVAAPGVLLASFVPMLLIASAFYYLNKVDQDCGTTFSWVTRAMGPWWGWQGGWAITMTGVLVIGALADVGVRFGLLTVGLDDLADDKAVIMIGAVALIFVMTAICVLGTELSARVQNVLIVVQVLSLLVFAAIAIGKVITDDATADALDPVAQLAQPLRGRRGGPHRRPAARRLRLLGLGVGGQPDRRDDRLGQRARARRDPLHDPPARDVRGGRVRHRRLHGHRVPDRERRGGGVHLRPDRHRGARRVGLDPALLRHHLRDRIHADDDHPGLPDGPLDGPSPRPAADLAHIHPRFRTPDVSTWWVAVIASVWYVVINLISENALFDSLTALSLVIAFYYALTGIACAIYYRRQLTQSVRNFVLIGVGPVVGAVLLAWLLVESVIDMSDAANSYSGQAWFGVGPPLVIGVLIFVTGLVLMFVWRVLDGRFWEERAGVVDPALVPGGKRGGS